MSKKPDLVPVETKPHYWLYKQGVEVWNRRAREAFFDKDGNDDGRIDKLIEEAKQRLEEVKKNKTADYIIDQIKRRVEILEEFKACEVLSDKEWSELTDKIRNGTGDKSTELPKVNEPIDFSNTIWQGNANFSGYIFPSSADFILANFLGNAYFGSAILINAKFSSAIFSGNAYFSSAILINANFNSANFKSSADFRSANFKSFADFRSANFKSFAHFRSANFSCDADFSSTNFKSADFNSTNFKSAGFNSTLFSVYAYFNSACFQGNADFRSAIFSDNADFNSASFSEKADFSLARFSKSVDFYSANFSDRAYFNSATFYLLLLNKTKFEGDCSFEGATFKKVPKVSGASILGVFNFYDVIWSKIEDSKEPKQDALSYSQLKRLMSDSHLHDWEMFFFRKELLCRAEVAKRKAKKPTEDNIRKIRKCLTAYKLLRSNKLTSWILKAKIFDSDWREAQFIKLYDEISECGDSIIKPFRKLLILYFTMAFLYPVISGKMSDGIFQGFYLSLRHTVLFLPSSKKKYDAIMCSLFPGYDTGEVNIQYLSYVLLSGFQAVLSLGLLFLVGLAIRNHFRIK
ncbi:MAG: hypothetical protein COV35_09625 [Alphaproteobacteria bacterium CG11_big_fil_rev_8_21_14_0_20_39_49]|nr:MAG: hypothetical protein COV35_09625 [Alphaproteobacteria bacterium CG11_big_fil_rev_8_21_14_0_20_39_49]